MIKINKHQALLLFYKNKIIKLSIRTIYVQIQNYNFNKKINKRRIKKTKIKVKVIKINLSLC